MLDPNTCIVDNFRDSRQWGDLPLKMINKKTFDTYLTLHNLNMPTGTKKQNKTKPDKHKEAKHEINKNHRLKMHDQFRDVYKEQKI